MPLFLLTQREIDLLNKLIKQVDGLTVNPPLRPAPFQDNPPSPGTYIAWPPSAGIPGLNTVGTAGPSGGDDQPGSATCDIYRIDDSGTAELVEIDGLDKTVYNFSEDIVPQVWIVITLTKSGRWVVVWAGNQAQWILFSLDEDLTIDMESASATVQQYWGGPDPGTTVTVYNFEDHTTITHVFAGQSGDWGYATYNTKLNEWEIIQLECPHTEQEAYLLTQFYNE